MSQVSSLGLRFGVCFTVEIGQHRDDAIAIPASHPIGEILLNRFSDHTVRKIQRHSVARCLARGLNLAATDFDTTGCDRVNRLRFRFH